MGAGQHHGYYRRNDLRPSPRLRAKLATHTIASTNGRNPKKVKGESCSKENQVQVVPAGVWP